MEGTVITKNGKALLAKLISAHGALRFTRVAAGAGIHQGEYDPESMEELLDYKMDGMLSKCEVTEDMAALTVQIMSPNLETGFLATEIGIFAKEDTDEADEMLYAYLDMHEDPQYIYASGSNAQKIIEITLEVVIANTEQVKAEIAPDSIVFRDELEEAKESLVLKLLDLAHPIGSIYTSTVSDDPAELFGGKWEPIKDMFLLTAGETYKAGKTGGEATHTLSVAEMPSHGHTYSGNTDTDKTAHAHTFSANTGTVSADHSHTGVTSEAGYHSHDGYAGLAGNHAHEYYAKIGAQTGNSERIGVSENASAAHKTSYSGEHQHNVYLDANGSHSHTVQTYGISANHIHGVSGTTGLSSQNHGHGYSGTTERAGSGEAHNNMPPYLVVYAWKRTA